MTYIDHIKTENTGGGTMVDFVVLKDGRVLGINDECVVLYKSIAAFWNNDVESAPMIDLIEY
jgi:hypothetical protein